MADDNMEGDALIDHLCKPASVSNVNASGSVDAPEDNIDNDDYAGHDDDELLPPANDATTPTNQSGDPPQDDQAEGGGRTS